MSIEGLLVGQVLSHKFGGVEDTAKVEIEGILYRGKHYSSLSKAGMAMLVEHGEVVMRDKKYYTKSTGKERSCGGWEFYGLTNPNARTVTRTTGETIIDPIAAAEEARKAYEATLQKIKDQVAAQSPEKLNEKLISVRAQICKLMDEEAKLCKILGVKTETEMVETHVVEVHKPPKSRNLTTKTPSI